jgi:hypothetical protein
MPTSPRLTFALVLVLLSLALLQGCAGGRAVPLDAAQRVFPYRTAAAHSQKWIQADSLWALRANPGAAKQSLKAYRSAVKKQRKAPELLARLSHACYFVASYINSTPEQRDALFREGQDIALEGMRLDPGFAGVFRESGDETEAALSLDPAYIELLYWYVVNLARELNQESTIIRRGNKARVESLNDRLLALDAGFYYAGPHRIAGAIPTRLPEGVLAESKPHFETAIALAPEYVGNRVIYADLYAVRAKDRNLFRTQLEAVLAAPEDTASAIAPENGHARAQAKALLAKMDALFK